MRVFKCESIWDKENQEWTEVYYIDGRPVDVGTYTEQLEVEELATEDDCDDMVESNLCKCCKCDENDNCNDYECTCKDIVEEDELCFCDECRKERFYHLLTDTLNCILEAEGCPECILELLLEFIIEFQDMGFRVENK